MGQLDRLSACLPWGIRPLSSGLLCLKTHYYIYFVHFKLCQMVEYIQSPLLHLDQKYLFFLFG